MTAPLSTGIFKSRRKLVHRICYLTHMTDMTQATVAHQCGVSTTLVSRIYKDRIADWCTEHGVLHEPVEADLRFLWGRSGARAIHNIIEHRGWKSHPVFSGGFYDPDGCPVQLVTEPKHLADAKSGATIYRLPDYFLMVDYQDLRKINEMVADKELVVVNPLE
jgi:hypothetical protein